MSSLLPERHEQLSNKGMILYRPNPSPQLGLCPRSEARLTVQRKQASKQASKQAMCVASMIMIIPASREKKFSKISTLFLMRLITPILYVTWLNVVNKVIYTLRSLSM